MRPIFAALILAVLSTGCSKFFGNLRRDFDDDATRPTIGGRWTEQGLLSDEAEDDRYRSVGHSERSPASQDYGQRGYANDSASGTSWISRQDAASNQRDFYRGQGVSEGESEENPVAAKAMALRKRRATRADFRDESPNEGSLWASDGQTNYYFTKNRIRSVGDIVTVNLEAPVLKDISMEIQRTLNEDEKELELKLARERKTPKEDPAAASRSPAGSKEKAKKPEAPEVTDLDIDVLPSLELKAGDGIMAEILERYPNGNYKLKGTKRIVYKNGTARMIQFQAIARGIDIGDDDTLLSGKLYEYRIESSS